MLEKTESFNRLLSCFFLSFWNHESYSIKSICVYSINKIETKVANKKNLEHFKMIYRRLFIPKFCNNSQMLLSSSWAIFIRALVFSFSTRPKFSLFEHLCFLFLLIFQFIFIQDTRVKTEKQLYYTKIENFQLCFIFCFDTTNHSYIFFLFNQQLQCSDFGKSNKR